MDLTASDYKKIASYYQIPKSKNKTYKEITEDVLASKLCRCIKAVDANNNMNIYATGCKDGNVRIFPSIVTEVEA